MEGAEQSFKDYWASTIHPAIKDDFERLLNTTPTRIAAARSLELVHFIFNTRREHSWLL